MRVSASNLGLLLLGAGSALATPQRAVAAGLSVGASMEYSLLTDYLQEFAIVNGAPLHRPVGIATAFALESDASPWALRSSVALYPLGGTTFQARVCAQRVVARTWGDLTGSVGIGFATFGERTLMPAITGAGWSPLVTVGLGAAHPLTRSGRFDITAEAYVDVYPWLSTWLPGPLTDLRLSLGLGLDL